MEAIVKKALRSYESLAIVYVSVLLLGCEAIGRFFG